MIDADSFGQVIVDGRAYSHDILITADGSVRNRTGHHTFTIEEFELLAEQSPDVIIVCLGHSSAVKVAPDVEKEAKRRGIKIIALPTPEAAELYNKLNSEEKNVKVAISVHITC